jgi:3-isopropylmalate/(R)-2-methylmalate dehydratase large subunit
MTDTTRTTKTTTMTMTQKILAAHCNRDSVAAGELILCDLDRVLGNDITAPVQSRNSDV